MSWKSMSIAPPHLGIGRDSKISSDFSRNSRIQSGSSLMSEIWLTTSLFKPFLAFENTFGLGAKVVLVDFADVFIF